MKHRSAALTALLLTGALALVTPSSPASATGSTNTITGRVSLMPGPTEPVAANRGDSAEPIVSANGRYVVFTSEARLVPEDPFTIEDVYVRDLLTDQVELISAKPDGTATASNAWAGDISADGRYVVFASISNQLVPGDTNNVTDVFLRDRKLKTTERVSINSAGQQSTKRSPTNYNQPDEMGVSDDGRYVAFTTMAPEMGVGGDVVSNIMVRDRKTSTTENVNVSSAEEQGNRGAYEFSMSANGRYVAFQSNSFNVATDKNGPTSDVFLRDRTAGTTSNVSLGDDDQQTFNATFGPSVSDDGNKVAFLSRGSLVPGDLTSIDDVFVRNVSAGTTTKISTDFGGAEADQHAEDPVISGDGGTVAWRSLSGEYVSGGSNGKFHIYKRVGTGAITRQSVTSTGTWANGDSDMPSLSKDGKVLVFGSSATNLVAGDSGFNDVFVRRNPEVGPHATTTAFVPAMVEHFIGSSPSTSATVSARILVGASPEHQVLLLANDPAFAAKRAPLVRLYVAYFKRLPDTSGLTYWLNKLNGGMKLDQVSAKFAASSEFKTKYGNTTNSQFVTLVYNNVLDRAPDPGGLSHWVAKLDGGMSRGTVMTNFSESSEGKRHFRPQVDTALVSLGLLGKIGPAQLMANVIDYMTLDGSERGVQRLISSTEYAAAV